MNEQLATVMRVLRLRQAALRVTASKLERGRDMVLHSPDGRLRDMFVYHQAHTGRWSSHGMQLHNLPRPVESVDYDRLLADLRLDTVDAEAARITQLRRAKDPTAPEVTADDILSSLVRLCIVPAAGHSFVVVDYAQIECRCLAWMARSDGLLDDLRDDVYSGMARRLYNDPTITKQTAPEKRNIGKVVVLGCGYGLSWRKLEMFCQRARIDLEASGLTAREAVDSFRKSYPAIPRLWSLFDARCKLAIEEGYSSEVGRCFIEKRGDALTITLPSNRTLWYRSARIESLVPAYAAFLDVPVDPKPTIVYEGPRGPRTLYGGKIVENVDQATCRDLLADAMMKIDAVGHVHDEIIAEVPTDRAAAAKIEIERIMVEGPSWARGLPIKVEGSICQRYQK